MKLAEVRASHRPSYYRHRLGSAPISGRPLYGWDVVCLCGWACDSNEPKAEAERAWREHTRERWEELRND